MARRRLFYALLSPLLLVGLSGCSSCSDPKGPDSGEPLPVVDTASSDAVDGTTPDADLPTDAVETGPETGDTNGTDGQTGGDSGADIPDLGDTRTPEDTVADTTRRDSGADTAPETAPDTLPADTGPARDTAPPDNDTGGGMVEEHVHISITNTCKLSVTPSRVTVPRGQTVSFVYHNHSRSYPADVWLSYGGGFTDLKPGKSWDDQFIHCSHAGRPYTASADITINGIPLNDRNCPGHVFQIECQ